MVRGDYCLLSGFMKAEIHPQPKPPLKSQPPLHRSLTNRVDQNHFASCLLFDSKSVPGLGLCDQFQIVAKDDVGTVACFQSHLVDIPHHRHAVADEAVAQRVLFPLHPGLARNRPLGFVKVA
jgi:hypothetical protein